MAKNQAAWLKAAGANALEVGPGPAQDTLEADEVTIKVSHVAINPVDWKIQGALNIPLPYPTILGTDVAGEIVAVGTEVSNFKPGDRVIGHCLGLILGAAKYGAFQNYTTCRAVVVAKIPDDMPFSEAVVLPLAISTSATGLFDILALDLPTLNAERKGKFILIWGGSSSCGAVGIQLATAAGYTVVTTASPHNHAFVKSLGAEHVFDQHDPDIFEKINAIVSKDFAGVLDCISIKTTQKVCAEIVRANGGGKLALLLPPEVSVEGVEPIDLWATVPGTTNQELGRAIWVRYVPEALTAGKLLPKPDSHIITGGLGKVQDAIELQKQGISAKKIVVEL